ncbi:MAG: superoxide dismutase [Omnitrophica WOR_2 bacterium]
MKGFPRLSAHKDYPTLGLVPKWAGWFWRRVALLFMALALVLLPASQALAAPAGLFPGVIQLPNGFNPEGIAIGKGTTFYVGSIPTGAIWQGDLRTGMGNILVPARTGRNSIGLAFDRRTSWIYVAGGATGAGYIYNDAGGDVAAFQFTSEPSFVNDVDVAPQGAYFTDSSRPFLYEVPLKPNGRLQSEGEFREIPLSGDFTFVPGQLNANGIDTTPDGKWLLIVHTFLGTLYRVDPKTGEAKLIDLGGGSVLNGDGILLIGRTLYVVQNFLNQVSVIKLNSDFTAGRIVNVMTSSNFGIPTTVDKFGSSLYIVNAHFDETPTPDTAYEVVRVPRH